MGPKDIPMENRIERKKKETKQKIIEVALDLFQRQGFNNITMEQIASKADIARKTLYNHFPVKEAIIDEYVKGISEGLAQDTFDNLRSLPDTKTRLLVALDKAYEWVEINPEITGICLGYRLNKVCQGLGYSDGETGTQSIMTEIIRYGQEAGEIRQDISAKILVRQLDILRSGVVMDWLDDKSSFELRTEMAEVVDLFINGAVKRTVLQK